MTSLRHLMNRKSQSCDDRKVAAAMRPKSPVTTERDNLFDLMNFVNSPTSDCARIGLALETTMVLSLMNLFGTIGHAVRFDP